MPRCNLISTIAHALLWGMEEGLNRLLDGEALLAEGVHVDRIVANAARRDRYGRSLLAKNIIVRTGIHDGAGQIEARSTLALLQRLMPTDKLDLLVELASGIDPAQIAAKRRIVAGAVRTRAVRARQLAREIAA